MIIYNTYRYVKLFFFPETYSHSKRKINIVLYLTNSATKLDLKNATGVETSSFAKNADLARLKSDVDNSDIYRLKTVSVDLYKMLLKSLQMIN